MAITDQPLVLEITEYDIETLEANKKRLLDQITPIVDYFAFDKVKRIMTMLDWEWSFPDGKKRVPHISELVETGRNLLTEVATKDIDYATTGGLKASKVNSDESDDIILKLEFVAESFDYDFVRVLLDDRAEVSGMTITNPDDELPF